MRAAVQALLHKSLAQGGEVEHAEGHADPFEDVLVAPPGFLQDAEGVLFLGDVAQHPTCPPWSICSRRVQAWSASAG